MWDYGNAVVKERTQPQNLAELRNYLRMEFGLGTEPGYLSKREGAEGSRRPRNRVRRALHRVIRALAKATGARPSSNGRRPGGGSTDPTR